MTRSNFPNSVDSFTELSEVLSSDKTDVDRYKVLLMQEVRTTEEETELTNLKNKLANKLVSSEHFNYLQDAIEAVQNFFLNETVPYLDSLEVGALRTDLGSPVNLETTDKSSLVNAVNELHDGMEMDRFNNNNAFDDLYETKANVSEAQMKKITADDGNVNIVFTTADNILSRFGQFGLGLRTFYAPTGATGLPPSGLSCRGFVHFTNSDIGWVWAIDYRNNVWTNYYNGTVDGWQGWTELSSKEQRTLWSGVTYLAGTTSNPHTLTPTKPLSQCRNGWILVWSDYDPAPTDKANDYNFVVSYIPKSFVEIFSGKGLYLHMITNISSETGDMNTTGKYVYVYDNQLVGVPENSTAKWANDVVLRRIIEW